MRFASDLMSLVQMSEAVEPAETEQKQSKPLLLRFARPALGLLLPLAQRWRTTFGLGGEVRPK